MVAYREGWNVERFVADTNALLEVRGHTDTVLAAASHVEEHGFTPFDALHLVNSGGRADRLERRFVRRLLGASAAGT